MTPPDPQQVAEIAGRLSKAQREAVMGCEQHGNGRYVYQLHGLAMLDLLAMQPVPALQMVEAYRLTLLGLAVRNFIQGNSHD